jgi:hypothetical protein
MMGIAPLHPCYGLQNKRRSNGAPFAILGLTRAMLPLDLIAQTQALQERRCLGILH